MSYKELRPVIVVTFMRSGTHLTMDLIRKQFDIGGFKYPGEALDALYVPLDVLVGPKKDAQRKVFRKLKRFNRPLFKSHYLSCGLDEIGLDYAELRNWLLEKGTWIYVYRNPAKVMASLYQFDKGYGRVDEPTDEWLMSRSRAWVRHVESWTSAQRKIHSFKFEDVLSDPEGAVERLSTILEMPPREIRPILPGRLNSKWTGRFRRLCALNSETTEILTEAKPLPLNSLFSDSALAAFDRTTMDIRHRLGYLS